MKASREFHGRSLEIAGKRRKPEGKYVWNKLIGRGDI